MPCGFELALDTFVKTEAGALTRDRFLRFDGYGFYVCVVVTESGFRDVSVRRGDRYDYEERYGDEPFDIVVEYDDITPKCAVVYTGSHRLQAGEVEEFTSRLNRAGHAVQAVNSLLGKLDDILAQTAGKETSK